MFETLLLLVATFGAVDTGARAAENAGWSASPAMQPGGAAAPEVAATEELSSTGGSLYLEQDSVLAPGTDKDYTMGVAATFSGWRVRRWGVTRVLLAWPLSKLDRHVAWFMAKAHDGICEDITGPNSTQCLSTTAHPEQLAYQAHGLQIGVTAFTPRKGDPAVDPGCTHRGCVLFDSNPVYDDRPYASLLYFSYRRETARAKWAFRSDLTLGVLGLPIADVVQSGIHSRSDRLTIPGGWHLQISDGGEPTGKYTFGFKYLALPVYLRASDGGRNHAGGGTGVPTERRILDATLDGEGNLGYYTNAAAGARLRVGYIDSPFWGADRQPISSVKRAGALVEARRRPKFTEAYLFASGGWSVWAYNALLQGQFRDSPVTLHFNPGASDPSARSPLNRAIWEWQAGARVATRWIALTYQYNRYRNLFEGPHERCHAFWSVTLTIF
jgi:hypothetical protein